MQAIRKEELFKVPGVAETLDWASALVELDAVALDPALVSDTLGVLLKYQDDIQKMQGTRAKQMLDQVRGDLKAAGVSGRARSTVPRPGGSSPLPACGERVYGFARNERSEAKRG